LVFRPGDFPLPIFEIVLKRITVRGSIVGTRNDLRETLAFANDGRLRRISLGTSWKTSTRSSTR
jgi:D-arabinose 1-dehydrogenase-like Zn-dependent alcohol dehydrogenase